MTMDELWNRLQTSYRDGTINKKDAELYKKWGAALKKLAQNPHYPSLNTYDTIKIKFIENIQVMTYNILNKRTES